MFNSIKEDMTKLNRDCINKEYINLLDKGYIGTKSMLNNTSNYNTLVSPIYTSHAEICPVCKGTGKYVQQLNPTNTTGINSSISFTCHGCNGKGWVTVSGS